MTDNNDRIQELEDKLKLATINNHLQINLALCLGSLFIVLFIVLSFSIFNLDLKEKDLTSSECAKLYVSSNVWAQDFFDNVAEEKFNRMVKDGVE